jgi:hypothetical protein
LEFALEQWLRAEVEAMIATKVAERRDELQSQLSKLLAITGTGNGRRSGRGRTRIVAVKYRTGIAQDCVVGLVGLKPAHKRLWALKKVGEGASKRWPNNRTCGPSCRISTAPQVSAKISVIARYSSKIMRGLSRFRPLPRSWSDHR